MVVTQYYLARSSKMFCPNRINWELLCDSLRFRTLKVVATGKHLIMIISNDPESCSSEPLCEQSKMFSLCDNGRSPHQTLKPTAATVCLLKFHCFVLKYFLSCSIQWICNGYHYMFTQVMVDPLSAIWPSCIFRCRWPLCHVSKVSCWKPAKSLFL